MNIALTRRADTVVTVHVSALSEASVDAVEGALDRNVNVFLMHLAVRTRIFWVAETSPVVAPSSVPTIVRASLHAAILATPPRLTPAAAVEAKPIVTAVVDARRNRAIASTELGRADAGTVLAVTVARAVVLADLD